jgi:hypothetical protein
MRLQVKGKRQLWNASSQRWLKCSAVLASVQGAAFGGANAPSLTSARDGQ